MLGVLAATLAAVYGTGALYGYVRKSPGLGCYPSPEEASREVEHFAVTQPNRCALHVIGESSEGRPIYALRVHGAGAVSNTQRPRLLVTAHIHAIEYIGSYVARGLVRQLLDGYGRVASVTALLDQADLWIVPLLNPDGAARIWHSRGWSRLGNGRFTATGVDPNRNFPFVPVAGRSGWNSGRQRRGSAYYRGPHPLSEPECLALARLCKRERFCAAINFHSFGGVVFMPQTDTPQVDNVLAVFRGTFQSHQRHRRYRPVPERAAAIVGQLDAFLLNAFGTPSVTVEVSRPGLHLLTPWNTFNMFWWCNPWQPEYWVENDAEATIHALAAVLERSGGVPCSPAHPELAEQVPE